MSIEVHHQKINTPVTAITVICEDDGSIMRIDFSWSKRQINMVIVSDKSPENSLPGVFIKNKKDVRELGEAIVAMSERMPEPGN